jgi:hypothetical protein
MKKMLFVYGFIALALELNAQDVIIKTNTEEIQCKIMEIEDTRIKYKNFSNLDGPVYSMNKVDIFMIKYENGQKEVFEKTASKESVQDPVAPKVDVAETNDNLPERRSAIRFGLSTSNAFNTVLVSTGTYTKNSTSVIEINSFYKNKKRWSSSVTLSPFNIISENIDVLIGGQTYSSNYDEQAKGLALLGEFYVHYAFSKKSSLYSGIGSGIITGKRILSESTTNYSATERIFTSAVHVTLIGAEYYFSKYVGVYSQLGIGRKSILNAGIQFQF